MFKSKIVENPECDIDWISRSYDNKSNDLSKKMFPIETARVARRFHRGIPGYKITPLYSLSHLANMIGVDSIWIKDEAMRLSLNSFKVIGGSFAIYRLIQEKLKMKDEDLSYEYLVSKECHKKLGDLTFASATDGNHGKGLAWIAQQLGYKCNIYVHSLTTKPRIKAIEAYGAKVKVIKGNYDDAVRQCQEDAEKNGWEVVSDTSWPGYENIPTWIMQGYNTILLETQEQLISQGITKPTHVFVQAGVGALAAGVIGFYSSLFPVGEAPKFIVVEPDNAACIYESAKVGDGKPHSVKGSLDTIMAGLACGEPSPVAWKVLDKQVDAFVKVPDYVAARGMRILATPLSGDPAIVSGESGAVTLGALYSMMLTEPKASELKEFLGLNGKSQVLFINTEGNTDPISFKQIIWDGSDPVPEKYFTTK